MKEKDKKKFSLGDIIRKFNEGLSSGDTNVENKPQFIPEQKKSLQNLQEDKKPQEDIIPQPSFANNINKSYSVIKDTKLPHRESLNHNIKTEENQPDESKIVKRVEPQKNKHEETLSSLESKSPEDSEEQKLDLLQYVGVLLRRKNIIIACIIIMSLFTAFNYMRAIKYYSAHARLLFSPGYRDIMGDNMSAWASWTRDEQRFNTHLELLKSRVIIERVSHKLDNKISPSQILFGLIISRGQSSSGEKNDILDIVFKYTDPALAKDVANQICIEYIEYMKEVSVQDITRLLVKLEDQINKMQKELDEKEDLLRDFKEKNRTVQLSSETNIILSKLSQMELSLQQTEMDMLESREKLLGLKREINQQDINVIQSITYSNPFQNKLAELELELNTASAEYSPDHFKVKMIKAQIDKLKEAMKTDIAKEAASRTLIKNPIRESLLQEAVSLSIEKSAMEAKRNAQQQIIKQLDEELSKLPSIELKYAQLTRETEALINVLKLLKSRYEEARIKRDSQDSDLKILEWAQLPTTGVSSMSLKKVLISLFIGIILGIVLAFLIEFLDQSIKEPQAVEKKLNTPLLGIIPLIEADKIIIDYSTGKIKNILEPFRALRATIKHIASVNNYKTFVVCSPVKGEGKTTLATNLAITMALENKKVFLIDADLRRPQIHSLFNVSKKIGLTDYLLGKSEINEIIKTTPHENLFIITSGESSHNSAELLGSLRFEQIISELKKIADYVIFDTPAIIPVSDTMNIAPKVDACIMVTRILWTPLKAALQSKNQLKRIGCNIIGAIINGISQSRGYYPYYYGYYRYYAYKYTYDEEEKKKKSFREIGLNIESKLKDFLRNFYFTIPHYMAITLNFLKYLLKRKIFWLLVFILLVLTLFSLLLKSSNYFKQKINLFTKSQSIQYIGPQSKGYPIESIRPQVTRDSSYFKDTLQINSKDAIIDSVFLWKDAINSNNFDRYLSFYDTLGFRFPLGTFREWKTIKKNIFTNSDSSFKIFIDRVYISNISPEYIKSDFYAKSIVQEDTFNRLYSLMWKKRGDGWYIVGEKYKEIK